MKQVTAGPGVFVVKHSLPVISQLAAKTADITISVDGAPRLHHKGALGAVGVLPLEIQTVVVLAAQATIRADITIDGQGIAANREGTLTATAAP